MQEGFDEGFSLGAEIGLLVGRVLGVLEGMGRALASDKERRKEVNELLERARSELAIEKVLGTEWVDEEGVFKWKAERKAGDEEVTFQEVASQHPVLKAWIYTVEHLTGRWGVDLEAVDKGRDDAVESEQS